MALPLRVPRKPAVMVRLYGCTLILIGALNLAMLVGPAIAINAILGMGEGFDTSRIWESLEIYVQQFAELTSVKASVIIYLFVASTAVSGVYVACGSSLLFRRPWARRPVIYALSTVVLLFVASYIFVALTTGRYLPTFQSALIYLLIPLAFIYRLTRADARQLFAGTP